MSSDITWEPRSLRDLWRLSAPNRAQVLAAIESYATTDQGDVVRLRDRDPPIWRLRVGDYRVLISFEATEPLKPASVIIQRVLHRRDAYR